MTQWIKRQLATPFMKSMAVLFSGTALANIIMLVMTPILMLLYTPAEFGILSVFTAILMLIIMFSSFCYYLAIVLPANDRTAHQLLVLSNIICVVLTVVCVIVFYTIPIAQIFNIEEIQPYILLIACSFLFMGLFNHFNLWALRFEDYQTIARSKVTMNGGQAVVQAVLGVAQFHVLGLLIGEVVGRFFGFMSYMKQYKKDFTLTRYSWGTLKKPATRYARFSSATTTVYILGNASTYISTLYLAAVFNLQTAGIFYLAQKILTAPQGLISHSAGQVFYSQASQMQRTGESLKAYSISVLKRVSALTILAMLAINTIIPAAVYLFFDTSWQALIPMLLIMTIMSSAISITAPFIQIFQICEMYRSNIISEAVKMLLIIGGIVVSNMLQLGEMSTLAVISITTALAYCLKMIVAWKIITRGGPVHATTKHLRIE